MSPSTLFLVATLMAGQTADPEPIRSWIFATPIGAELEVTLESGEVVSGPLADRDDARFGVWTEADDAAKRRHGAIMSLMRRIEYADVARLAGARITGAELADRLRIGDRARVHTSSGEVLAGTIEDVDVESMRIAHRRLDLRGGDVVKIELRDDDPVSNGALIGLGVGAGLIGLLCLKGCEPALRIGWMLMYGGAGAGIGALIDDLNHGYTTISMGSDSGKKLTFAPILTGNEKGVLVSFSF